MEERGDTFERKKMGVMRRNADRLESRIYGASVRKEKKMRTTSIPWGTKKGE